MKKYFLLPALLIFIASFLSIFIYLQKQSVQLPLEDTKPQVKGSNVEVLAKVGEYYLSVSGYVSPFASLVMTDTNDVFLRSAVADEQGNFYMSQILIKPGFSGFCLTAVDIKKIGESITCFTVEPANGDIIMNDIFLPPTLGIARTEIAEDASTTAFGYTMPGALVTLKFSNGKTLTVTADDTGYYIVTIEGLPAGTYELYAIADYQGKQSLSPSKHLQLKTLSLAAQTGQALQNLWDRFWDWLRSLGLGLLWIALAILILIIILIIKIWPEKFRWLFPRRGPLVIFPHEQKREKQEEELYCLRYCYWPKRDNS